MKLNHKNNWTKKLNFTHEDPFLEFEFADYLTSNGMKLHFSSIIHEHCSTWISLSLWTVLLLTSQTQKYLLLTMISNLVLQVNLHLFPLLLFSIFSGVLVPTDFIWHHFILLLWDLLLLLNLFSFFSWFFPGTFFILAIPNLFYSQSSTPTLVPVSRSPYSFFYWED